MVAKYPGVHGDFDDLGPTATLGHLLNWVRYRDAAYGSYSFHGIAIAASRASRWGLSSRCGSEGRDGRRFCGDSGLERSLVLVFRPAAYRRLIAVSAAFRSTGRCGPDRSWGHPGLRGLEMIVNEVGDGRRGTTWHTDMSIAIPPAGMLMLEVPRAAYVFLRYVSATPLPDALSCIVGEC